MRRCSLILLLACFCLGSSWLVGTSPTVLATEPVQVILLAGQSNMDGHAMVSQLPTTPFNFQEPQDDVLLYFGDPSRRHPPGSEVPAKTLISLQPGASSQGGITRFGPEVTFGRAIADAKPDRKYALIKHGVGGSSLAKHWDPTVPASYSDFKLTVAEGLAALEADGHATQITGMLWMQGETDVKKLEDRNAYEENLTNFIAAVRTDFGSDLPFVIGQLSVNQTGGGRLRTVENLNIVRTAQANVARDLLGVGLVVTNNFSLNADDLHFSTEGQMALGNAFAKQYLALVPEPDSLPALLIGGLICITVMRPRRQNA